MIEAIQHVCKNVALSLKNELLGKTLINASWLIGDKIFYMVIGVFVTSIVARYLGPDTFGLFNYALSFVALFTAISTLGLETLTVKAIIDEKFDEGTILCTSLVMRICGGLALTLMAVGAIKVLEPDDTNLHILVLIMSFTMVLRSLEVIEYWIQANQKSKISAFIRMSTYSVIAILKISMVLMGGSIITYAFIYLIDAIIIGIALVIAYIHIHGKAFIWRFNVEYSKDILTQSWYLILSGLMITLYMRLDQVMLGAMLPNKIELGVYSAAVRVAEMWYFVPFAIITSFKPIIMKKKQKNETEYIRSVQLLYRMVAWIGIIFGILILLCSQTIVFILYGVEYAKAADILSINIWAGTFATLGAAQSIWLVCEGLQKYTVVFTFAGCICNVLINYFLIPIYGGFGAAIATLVSYIMTVMVIPVFVKKTSISSLMIIKAFALIGIGKE